MVNSQAVPGPYLLLCGIQDRYSALYSDNLRVIGANDIPIASIGGSGQTYLGQLLEGLALNYADPYVQRISADGSNTPEPAYSDYLGHVRSDDNTSNPLTRLLWPRFLKTHLTPEFFAHCNLRSAVVLLRDPRDSLYSWFNFRRNFVRDPLDLRHHAFADWLQAPGPTGLNRLDDWSSFYKDWLTRPAATQVVVTRFEDLKLEPATEVPRLLQAAGVPFDESLLASALTDSSFDRMQTRESASTAAATSSGQRQIMRRGKVAEWKEWITDDLAELFSESEAAEVARQNGYDI